MPSMNTMHRNFCRNLLAGDSPTPAGATSVEVVTPKWAATEKRLTVFIRLNNELSVRLLTMRRNTYPTHFLANTMLMAAHAVEYFRQGHLIPDDSELFTAILAGIPGVTDTRGTTIDNETATWKVPHVDIETHVALVEQGTPLSGTSGRWFEAMTTRTWPNVPDRTAKVPRLQVVHLPSTPFDELNPAQQRRVIEATLGYNNMTIVPASSLPEFLKNSTEGIIRDLANAQKIMNG